MGADGKPDGPSLEPLIQFGIAGPSSPSRSTSSCASWSAHGIANWGWAIIVFTVIFTLVMLPTRIMMTKSSFKMMRIQPKVDAIKKRYRAPEDERPQAQPR